MNRGDWNEKIEGTFNEIAQVGVYYSSQVAYNTASNHSNQKILSHTRLYCICNMQGKNLKLH